MVGETQSSKRHSGKTFVFKFLLKNNLNEALYSDTT